MFIKQSFSVRILGSTMASSLRHIASPRSFTSALTLTPKFGSSARNLLHQSRSELAHSSLSRNLCSPVLSVLSPELSPSVSPSLGSSPRVACAAVLPHRGTDRFKSARKLPWSHGESKNCENDVSNNTEILAQPLQPPFPKCTEVFTHQPSVSTPDRPQLFKRLRSGSRCAKVLGKGSFGMVLEAKYRGKVVAVKVVREQEGSSSQVECETNALHLHHPNVVATLKVVQPTHDVEGFVLMERVLGHSLQSFLDEMPLPSSLKLRCSLDISQALQYCHSQGVLHLDVKPKNILIDLPSNTCKLCDFGSSARLGAKGTHSVKGTIGYTAPELLCGDVPTAAADVYSLGITMWQMMSRENPFEGDDDHSVIFKVVSRGYRPKMPAAGTAVDELFIGVFKKCWAQNPCNRPTVHQITNDLVGVINGCINVNDRLCPSIMLN